MGLKVIQDKKSGIVWIRQPAYTESVLQKFGMENAKAIDTPADPRTNLVKATEKSESVDQQLHQSAVDSLLYLSNGTTQNSTYAVSSESRYYSKLEAYFRFGLLCKRNGISADCIEYSDVDWAGGIDNHKATSG